MTLQGVIADVPRTLGLVGAAIVVVGLDYTGVSSDHHQYLLPVRRSADPTFLMNDWFAEATQSYHPTFEGLLRVGGRLAGEAAVLAGLRAASLVTVVMATYILLRALRAPVWALPVPLLLVSLGAAPTWGSVDLLGTTALPHYLGLSLACLAVALLVADHRRAAVLVSVAAFYAHVSVGVWLGILIAVVVLPDLLRGGRARRELLVTGGLALLALAPMIAWAQQSFLGGSPAPPDSYRILFQLRSPHHYDLVSLPASAHLGFASQLAAALAVSLRMGPVGNILRRVSVTIAVAGALGWFFLHVAYWPLYLRLFPYRLVPLVAYVAAVGGVALLARSEARIEDRAVGCAACLVVLWLPVPTADPFVAQVALSALLVVALATFGWVRRGPGCPRGSVAGLAVVATATTALVASPPNVRREATVPQQMVVAHAVAEEVPVGGTVVAPPGVSWLRLESGRATVVDFKSFPMEGQAMVEWRDRLRTVTGHALRMEGPAGFSLRGELDARFDARPLADLIEVADQYRARHLLLRADTPAALEAAAGGLELTLLPGFVLVRLDV
jgi:hypothetical protein